MFIYSYYAQHGFESPQRLVKAISKKTIKEVCLIDDKGMAIPSFLHSCMEEKIKVSFAIRFSAFIEGKEEKQDGYFITGEKEGLETIMNVITELKEKWIPFLSQAEIKAIREKNSFCFLREENGYSEIVTGKSLAVKPVGFINEEDRLFYESFNGESNYGTVENNTEEKDSFVQEISTNACDFLRKKEMTTKKVNVESLVEWEKFSKKERRQIKKEIAYFHEKNDLIMLHSLARAKKEGVIFYANGKLHTSLLAFALGVTYIKPEENELYFDFNERFEYSIVITKGEQKQLFRFLQEHLEVRYPLAKYDLEPKKALRKAQEILGERSAIAGKLNEHETLDVFMNRMRVQLIVNEKEKRILDFACYLSKTKEEKCTLKKNYLLFMPEITHLAKDEEVVYVDVENLDILSIPYIKCLYPSQT